MKAPSEPKIDRSDPEKYFIYWNHDVPEPLWPYYLRKRIRIKMYEGDINRYRGNDREKQAEKWRQVWKYNLDVLRFNPFEDELEQLKYSSQAENLINTAVEEKIKEAKKQDTLSILTREQQRQLTPIRKALSDWVESRRARTTNSNSVSTYRVTATWLTKYFETIGRASDPISSVTRLEIADGLNLRQKERNWEATTYNNEYDTLTNVFNWLKREEYIRDNPITGTIDKIKTKKHKHKWFDKDLLKKVKEKLIEVDEMLVYRVMQFTYWIMIRNKTELMKLKAGDIDRTLRRIHFSAELSKNNREAYRDYDPEFEAVLDQLNFDAIPKNFYIFGRGGNPSEYKCHKDLFADRWRPVRNLLGLSDDYTIYGIKHTRIVHEMMKGTDGRMISYMARHEDPKSTKDYQRDYDITLLNVYGPEDLKF